MVEMARWPYLQYLRVLSKRFLTFLRNAIFVIAVCAFTLTSLEVRTLHSGVTTQCCKRRGTYRAAVYEHAPIYPPYMPMPVTRETAVRLMERNLEIYRQQAAIAKSLKVDILVFPENGIFGYNHSRRDLVYPYLEYVPDPDKVSWSPCDDPDLYLDTDVQQALSCMAKTNSLYLVATIGDKQACDPKTDVRCPVDGRLQYNTAVVYGPDGRLLVKYHKNNLYKEAHFDQPDQEVKYFDTPFGRFGLLVCFDLLFSDPALTLVRNLNIKNIVFPTGWMDALPLLSALGYHSSFARGLGVNLLAANLHDPGIRAHGSGIYTPAGVDQQYYYNNRLGSPPQLVVADVHSLSTSLPATVAFTSSLGPSSFAATSLSLSSYFSSASVSAGLPLSFKLSPSSSLPLSPSSSSSSSPSPSSLSPPSLLPLSSSPLTDVTSPFSTSSKLTESVQDMPETFENKNYTLVELTHQAGHAKVCRGSVCCYLDYAFVQDGARTERFVLGAHDGVYKEKYYFKVCTVQKCRDLDRLSCGLYTVDSRTKFTSLTLVGDFSSDVTYPQVLLSNEGQLELPRSTDWSYSNNEIRIAQAVTTPLLEVTLLGRVFSKDPGHIKDTTGQLKDVTVSSSTVYFAGQVFNTPKSLRL